MAFKEEVSTADRVSTTGPRWSTVTVRLTRMGFPVCGTAGDTPPDCGSLAGPDPRRDEPSTAGCSYSSTVVVTTSGPSVRVSTTLSFWLACSCCTAEEELSERVSKVLVQPPRAASTNISNAKGELATRLSHTSFGVRGTACCNRLRTPCHKRHELASFTSRSPPA